MKRIFLTLFLIFIYILSVEGFEFIEQFEGNSSCVKCYGNYGYFNAGGNIYVLDISEPDEIYIINKVHIGELYCFDIEINNDLIFFATVNGTYIYSLDDPINPQFISQVDNYFTKKLIVQDSLLISGISSDAIIYQISDPFNPIFLSYIDFPFNDRRLYCLNNNVFYGFCQIGYSGPEYINGYDISDPTNPELISQLYLGSGISDPWPDHMEINQNKLFIAVNDTLKIYDISNEEEISFINSFPISEDTSSFKILNDILYVCYENSGIFVIDISDFNNPIELGSYQWEAEFSDIDINFEFALISANYSGFKIINITEPDDLFEQYYYNKTDTIWRLRTENNLAYISSKEDGFQVLDISDNQNHIELGSIDLEYPEQMKKYDNYFFYQCYNDSILYIIDVSDSYSPTICNQLVFSDNILDYCINDDKLFILEFDNGIHTYDITVPSNPTIISFAPISGYNIEVENDLLFLAINDSEFPYTVKLNMYDIENILNFNLIDQLILGDYFDYNILEIISDYPKIYLGIRTGLVSCMINASDELIICDELLISGWLDIFVHSFYYDSDFVYGIQYGVGLQVFNVSNINNLEIETTIQIAPQEVFRQDNILYIACASAGYVLYEISNSGSDPDDIISENSLILLSNYPNPFNPTTTIEFSIQNNSKIELTIYNIKGQRVNSLVNNDFEKGKHSVIWNGYDELGDSVSSGVYLYKLNVNGKTESTKKCILLK